MNGYKNIYFIIIVSLFISSILTAQEKKLSKEKVSLKQKIKFIESLIKQNENSKKISISQINSIKIKIASQKKLISTINDQINNISTQISQFDSQAKKLESDIKTLKKIYSNTIIKYQNDKSKNSTISFILSSKDFQQLIRRLKYIKLFSSYRKQQALEIKKKKNQIEKIIINLQKIKTQKLSLIEEEKKENLKLQKSISLNKNKLQKLQKKRSEYLKDIKKMKKRIASIEKKIKKIISEKIKKSKDIKGIHPFERNKSKISFPLNNGIITREFGIQPYPGLKDVFIENSGIHISTTKKAKALAVFDGQVAAVYIFPLGSVGVLIKHGQFYTFYGNLAKSFVSLNQKVKKNDEIGLVFTDPSTKVTELDFQIWKRKQKLNPKHWLANYKKYFLD